MGKLTRRAGRPMGKKIFGGPASYRRGGHMRPGPGCQTEGVAYGAELGHAASRAVRVVQVAQKECDFGKKVCAI